jgi:hypothetical protein
VARQPRLDFLGRAARLEDRPPAGPRRRPSTPAATISRSGKLCRKAARLVCSVREASRECPAKRWDELVRPHRVVVAADRPAESHPHAICTQAPRVAGCGLVEARLELPAACTAESSQTFPPITRRVGIVAPWRSAGSRVRSGTFPGRVLCGTSGAIASCECACRPCPRASGESLHGRSGWVNDGLPLSNLYRIPTGRV